MTRSPTRILTATFAEPVFPRVTRPVDVTDEAQFPEIAAARAWVASLSPERRAVLNAEWEN